MICRSFSKYNTKNVREYLLPFQWSQNVPFLLFSILAGVDEFEASLDSNSEVWVWPTDGPEVGARSPGLRAEAARSLGLREDAGKTPDLLSEARCPFLEPGPHPELLTMGSLIPGKGR